MVFFSPRHCCPPSPSPLVAWTCSGILAADPPFGLNPAGPPLVLNSHLVLFSPSLEISLLLPTSCRTVLIIQVALVALHGLCQTSSHAPFPLFPPPSQRSGHTDLLGVPPQSVLSTPLCLCSSQSLGLGSLPPLTDETPFVFYTDTVQLNVWHWALLGTRA